MPFYFVCSCGDSDARNFQERDEHARTHETPQTVTVAFVGQAEAQKLRNERLARAATTR